MSKPMQQWQFNSNADTFGVHYAATIARKHGVPLSTCLMMLRYYLL